MQAIIFCFIKITSWMLVASKTVDEAEIKTLCQDDYYASINSHIPFQISKRNVTAWLLFASTRLGVSSEVHSNKTFMLLDGNAVSESNVIRDSYRRLFGSGNALRQRRKISPFSDHVFRFLFIVYLIIFFWWIYVLDSFNHFFLSEV